MFSQIKETKLILYVVSLFSIDQACAAPARGPHVARGALLYARDKKY
jgi:hypothetical protein